jgi:hypothetical protein
MPIKKRPAAPSGRPPKAIQVAQLASAKPDDAGTSALQISMLHELLERIFTEPGPTDMPAFDAAKIKRYRLSSAAHVIGDFLKQTGARPEVYKRINEVGSALFDLDRGTVHPTLRPISAWQRPPDRTDIWSARACAVLGFECLLATMTAPNVKKKVAKSFPGLERLCSGSNRLSSSIIQWRRSLKEPNFKIDFVQDEFTRCADWVASQKVKNPKQLLAIGEQFLRDAEAQALAISPLSSLR